MSEHTAQIGAVESLGLDVRFEMGLAIAPSLDVALSTAKALAAYIDSSPTIPVRLAGLTTQGGRVVFTLGVTLGSLDEVKTATGSSREAVLLLQTLVDEFAAHDPAFALLPEAHSAEARLAHEVTMGSRRMELATAVEHLVAVA